MANADKTNHSPKLSRPGAAAARNLQAVQDLRAAEERRRQTYRRQLEEAERAAAFGQSRLRRIAREQRNEQERHLARLLGQMALGALKRQGISGSLLSANDLDSWQPQDLSSLKEFLSTCAHNQDSAAITPALAPKFTTELHAFDE